MNYYFQLQLKRLERRSSDFGVHPIVASVVVVFVFFGASFLLFTKTPYANWIYLATAFFTVLKLSDSSRTELLNLLFTKNNFFKVRIIENLIIALPFSLMFVFQRSLEFVFGVMILSFLLAFVQYSQKLNWVIPTPFKNWPFEFIVGFRKSFFLLFGVAFLLFKAVEVGNFNLGLFALLVVHLFTMSFYFQPETDFFVWVYSAHPVQFLQKKISIAIIGNTILTLLIAGVLVYAFPDNWMFVVGLQVLGWLFLTAIILAKYAAYPKEIGLPQAIILAFSFGFPPFLLLVIPYFFSQSRSRLNHLLK